MSASAHSATEYPHCKCGLPCGEPRVVAKDTPNRGRAFFGCPRFGTVDDATKCNFFQWANAMANNGSQNSMGSTGKVNSQTGGQNQQHSQNQNQPGSPDEGSTSSHLATKFYKTPTLRTAQEPTPAKSTISLPNTELASFGQARIAAALSGEAVTANGSGSGSQTHHIHVYPPSPSPLAIPKPEQQAQNYRPMDEDDLCTPVDRLPPPVVPTAPRAKRRIDDHRSLDEEEVRPRRLFGGPDYSFSQEDSQVSMFGGAGGYSGHVLATPASPNGLPQPISPILKQHQSVAASPAAGSVGSQNNPVSGTETRYSTKFGMEITSRSAQTAGDAAINSTSIFDYVKGIEEQNATMKRQLNAKDKTIESLRKEVARLKGSNGVL